MAQHILGIIFLSIWPVATQSQLPMTYKTIVPREVKLHETFYMFCDTSLAGIGVDQTPLGVQKVQLTMGSMHATFDNTTYSSALKQDWLGYYFGRLVNEHGFFDAKKRSLLILVLKAEESDSGEICCSVTYPNTSLAMEEGKRCETVKVTNKAIVNKVITRAKDPALIMCDADLAGVPMDTTELETLTLSWVDQLLDGSSRVLFNMSVEIPNGVNILKNPAKSHWAYTHTTPVVNPNKMFNKTEVTLGITINETSYTDTGYFCCAVTYLNTDGDKIFKHGCQYLDVVNCPLRSTLENGKWKNCSPKGGCTIECDPGYVLEGPATVHCVVDVRQATWTEQGKCVQVGCVDPPSVDHGNWKSPCERTVGSICSLECEKGYNLDGADYVMCVEKSYQFQWSNAGTCKHVGVTCELPPEVQDGDWRHPCEHTVDSVCYLTCNEGYIVSGVDSITCHTVDLLNEWSEHGECKKIAPYTIIVPSSVIATAPFIAGCEADWSILKQVYKLELSWKTERNPLLFYHFGYTISKGNYSFLGHHNELKSAWLFSVLNIPPENQPFTASPRLEIEVPKADFQDTGMYCCEVTYNETLGTVKTALSCQNLTDDSHIFLSEDIPLSFIRNQNASFPLTCNGGPDAENISIYRLHGYNLTIFRESEITHDMPKLTCADSGVYKCQAKPKNGTVIDRWMRLFVNDSRPSLCDLKDLRKTLEVSLNQTVDFSICVVVPNLFKTKWIVYQEKVLTTKSKCALNLCIDWFQSSANKEIYMPHILLADVSLEDIGEVFIRIGTGKDFRRNYMNFTFILHNIDIKTHLSLKTENSATLFIIIPVIVLTMIAVVTSFIIIKKVKKRKLRNSSKDNPTENVVDVELMYRIARSLRRNSQDMAADYLSLFDFCPDQLPEISGDNKYGVLGERLVEANIYEDIDAIASSINDDTSQDDYIQTM
ncbi:uncharacterized protein LOC131947914 [Physella acuta]|uniref:uncharacterized protein LOC131947914 n=1 Tax=Physella acuta TaxID=109671 RepID=UPI0027DCF818|nr:uncharacterized protein LOC131947914 [Physella acuta]